MVGYIWGLFQRVTFTVKVSAGILRFMSHCVRFHFDLPVDMYNCIYIM